MEESGLDFDPKMVDSWVSIWNSYDLSMVDKLFINDPRLTYFSSEKEGVVKGFEAVRRHHVEFGFVEGGKDQPNRLWLEDTEIDAFPRVAVVKAVWCFQRGGSEKIQCGPVTLVYVQTGDEYRIAHAHFSNY
jgi:hypothetical protein